MVKLGVIKFMKMHSVSVTKISSRTWLLCLIMALALLPLCSAFRGGLRGGGDDAVSLPQPPHLSRLNLSSERKHEAHPHLLFFFDVLMPFLTGKSQAAAEANKYAQEQVTYFLAIT